MTRKTLIGDQDLHHFNEGTSLRAYEKMGSHYRPEDGGTYFAVWAPSASAVSVVGDFNRWNTEGHKLRPRQNSGIWEGFVREAGLGDCYKYRITPGRGPSFLKADPMAFCHEEPPRTASRIWSLDYPWGDQVWMNKRKASNSRDAPLSIYEVHLGSWLPREKKFSAPLYREIAAPLAAYVKEMGFTHVEFLPVMEHPFYGSWGYQTTGYFAPTSRYGTPQDLMSLVDFLHQNGIGVILDWVPSHFPNDPHGLANFDGTCLYEHEDPRKGFHPDWKSAIFNYGRHEVRSFLLSSALYWLDRFHADGLRVDAVASMLYLDYSRKEGEWTPNAFGGRENLEAILFLRQLNESVYREHPDVQVMAEESTSWPMVSRPASIGGLGFGFKWDMGWMNDTLRYFSRDAVHRKYHHDELTFRMLYAFSENFVLPLSHDEVVHGKGSLLNKMSGDDWQKFANLRLLLSYFFAQPGKKLLFMGGEFAQWAEWDHERGLEWNLLTGEPHRGMRLLVGDLNRLYRSHPALHQHDHDSAGFEWLDCHDTEQSVLTLLRKGGGPPVAVALNFTPIPRLQYRIGVPEGGRWGEIFNSDAREYGGSGLGNIGGVEAAETPWHGRPCSVKITLPPLAAVFLQRV